MTNNHAGELLAQILSEPLDDAPRNVYADLLQERGDPRGRLIHLQLRRAALPEWDPQVTELELQERALLETHGAVWRAALPKLRGVTWGSFTRGFVGKVAFDSLDAFVEHRDACRAAAPVHAIVIRWPRRAKAKQLALDELDVSDNDLDADAAAALMSSRALAQLKMLSLDRVRSKHFDRIAQAPWIHSLRVLSCGESALEQIVKRSPRELHAIRVVAEGSAAHGVAKKLTSAPLPALTSLDLSASLITDPSLRVLGGVDTLPNLVAVKLAPVGGATAAYTAEGAAEFARSPLGNRLRSLRTGIAEIDQLPPPPQTTAGDGEYRGPFRYL